MSSLYTLCPAFQHNGSYFILRSIEKRLYAFLRCRAARFPLTGDEVRTVLASAELFDTPAEFRDATAKLPVSAILSPIEGGSPVILYLARPGKEEDFSEIASDLQEEEPLTRIETIPDPTIPLILIFADPSDVVAWSLGVPEMAVVPQPEPRPEPPGPSPRPDVELEQPPQPEPEPQSLEAAPSGLPVEVKAEPVPLAPPAQTEAPPEQPAPPELTVAPPQPEVEPDVTPLPPQPTAELEQGPPADTLPEPQQPETPLVVAPVAEATPPQPEPAPELASPMPPDRPPEAEALPEAPTVPPRPARKVEPPAPAPPPVKPSAALRLGETYYALRAADTAGSTVVVWQARRLSVPPGPAEFEIIAPSAETRQRLIAEGHDQVRYADEGQGELAAIKIARPGREADLERSLMVLRRLGPRALRLHYPGPALSDALWPADFPSMVVEWASGMMLNDSPAFSERRGLEVCFQLADLMVAARQAAPDIVLTDSLKPDNVIVVYDDRGDVQVRVIDWNVYATQADDVRAATATAWMRFGEIMVRVFAPDMPFAVDWTTRTVPLHLLGAGRPGDPGALEWDALTHGTRTLIRRALQGAFEGDADRIFGELRQAIKDQQARWAENDPAWQARQETGPGRLNWLDIAAAKQGRVSEEVRARLDESRRRELREIVDGHADAGRHLEAVIDLYTAVRHHPDEAYFRWALLAHSIAIMGPERSFQRLHLDEGLTHLSAGRHDLAERALARGLVLFEDLLYEPAHRETAHDYLEALSLCAQTLALVESALVALAEDWRVEEAEFRLAQAEDLQSRGERLARRLLTGRDPMCQQKMVELREAIAAFYAQHAGYDPAALAGGPVEQERWSKFNRLIERARSLAQQDQPDMWTSALHLYDRADEEYPDLWRDGGDQERRRLTDKLARRKLDEAGSALAAANWSGAVTALAQAVLYPDTRADALRLQAALSAYQRGELEMRRGDFRAAAASFTFAAENSSELRKLAEQGARSAQEAARASAEKDQGPAAPALEAMVAAVKLDLEGLRQEWQRQFSEQQALLKATLSEAASRAQEQSAQRQQAALKALQAEQWNQQQAALKKLQEEQANRLQAIFTQLQNERSAQQQSALKKLHEEQLAALRGILITLHDEQSEGRQAALKKVEGEEPARQQAALKQSLEDLATRQKAALDQLKSELSTQQQAALQQMRADLEGVVGRPPATSSGQPSQGQPSRAPTETSLRDVVYKLQDNAARQRALANGAYLLFALNLLLMVVICGLALYVGPVLLRGTAASGVPTPLATPTPIRPSPVAPTVVAPTRLPPSPTVAPTARPKFTATLDCTDATKARSSYDCMVTNTAAVSDNLSLAIKPEGGQLNGFNPSINVGDQPAALPDSRTNLISLGEFDPGQSQEFKLHFACIVSSGCQETTFLINLLVNQGTTLVPDDELKITTKYFPPEP